MSEVRWVEYGRPAAEALRETIAQLKGDDPLTPVTVVVPSNHVGVATRRRLASLGPREAVGIERVGIVAVTFLTVYRLAELHGAAALAAAGRRPVSTPVIGAAIRGALAVEPGVFAPVAGHPATEAALVASYRELRDVGTAVGAALGDVADICQRARAALRTHWYDEEDLMASAAASPPPGPAVLYLPQRLSRHAAALLRALEPLTIIAGTTGSAAADAEVVASVQMVEPSSAAPPPTSTGAVPRAARVVSTSDADQEVRVVARAIVDAARTGTRLDRIAVLHPGVDPYPRLIHEQLAAAGIPRNGPAVMPLTARVAGRSLLGLLEVRDNGFRREDVFAWLSSAPLRFGGSAVPAAAWERVSRLAGVVGGRPDWDERLDHFASSLRAAASNATPDDPPWRAERDRDDARRAQNLRRFMLDLIDAVPSLPRAWSDHTAWARAFIGRVGPTDAWPDPEEIDAYARVLRALDRLAALDAVEGPVGIDVFSRTLRLELEADLGRAGRFGHGVFVGPLSMGIGLDLDLVVLVGLAEGSLPSTVREDSLLPDRVRRAVGLPLAVDRTERQHRWLLVSLSSGGDALLTFPRGDLRRSTQRVPSRWLTAPAVEEPSFDSSLRGAPFPATAQEHRLRAAVAGQLVDHVVAAGTAMITARRSDRFTRFDGNLAGIAVRAPQVTSATRLERWAHCPFAYLLGDVLGVDEVDNPEDHLQMTPLVRGELVHLVLEQFVVEVLARPPEQQPGPDDRWTDADRDLLLGLAAEQFARFERAGLSGRPIFWSRERDRLERELLFFLLADEERRRLHRTRLFAAELGFTDAPFPLPSGRVVRFRGKADRIDIGDDGTLRVVDYKTGKADGYTKLGPDDPDAGGTKLQLPIYAQAARHVHGDAPVHAEYWFVTGRGGFKHIGLDVTDDVMARVGCRVDAILRGIEHGVFPNHPQGSSTSLFIDCPYCDPDGLGETDLRRAWERKRDDPALAPFLEAVGDA